MAEACYTHLDVVNSPLRNLTACSELARFLERGIILYFRAIVSNIRGIFRDIVGPFNGPCAFWKLLVTYFSLSGRVCKCGVEVRRQSQVKEL